jgi:hypothetical protein
MMKVFFQMKRFLSIDMRKGFSQIMRKGFSLINEERFLSNDKQRFLSNVEMFLSHEERLVQNFKLFFYFCGSFWIEIGSRFGYGSETRVYSFKNRRAVSFQK